MKEFIKYVGMNVHKETIAVSVAPGNAAQARYDASTRGFTVPARTALVYVVN